MTIEKITQDHFDDALRCLQNMSLSKETIVFRGQQDTKWRLHTTWARFKSFEQESRSSDMVGLLDQFKTNLAKLGQMPFEENNHLDWLEYAQHHGVPTPYLDFTYSPYVALFFSFNGLEDIKEAESEEEYVVVYALNINQLAHHWAKASGEFDERVYQSFLSPSTHLFDEGFPGNTLQFIRQPGKSNARMQRQQGAFLYDTLDYHSLGFDDLEEYMDHIQESKPLDYNGTQAPPTLTKVFINKKCIREVFQILELMNITGTMLFLDSSGAAMDVRNTYYYKPKTMMLRGFD
ncbi:FRG domain-containing protein [Halobacillus seohaensis]|uniref:FRG domain-containing protein n=1 Tax=Halobacillus seohaensis TaxID=447421 RepID=A0ABW2EMN4_9BACI